MSSVDSHTYAIFATRYAPLTGGVESFSQRLAHELVKQDNRALVVTSQVGDAPHHEMQDDGVEVYRLPAWQLLGSRLPISRRNAEYEAMLDELAGERIDRVLVNNRFYRHSLEGVRFARRIGAPVYVLDHGSAHLTMGNGALDRLVERYEHAVTKRMRSLGPCFAGISQASVDWLAHFGIDTDVVIPNAIDVAAFRDVATKEVFNASDVRTVVAFVGRLEPEKGALEFARAAAMLGPGFACVMAGDGSLRERIEELGIGGLALLGKVDQPRLSALLRDASVFCLPSRSEGFCTSLLEAAAQGAIPVMPHVGGTDEVMGFDPVRFGIMLDGTDPEQVAAGVREASVLTGQSDELSRYVEEHCSWARTVEALDVAFRQIG